MILPINTLLLTGASGSFGRAFIATAFREGVAERIVAVSRNAEQRYRLEQACPDPRLIVVPGDVRIVDDLWRVVRAFGPIDAIIHAAAEKHVGTGEKFAEYVTAINVDGARNVLSVARAAGVGKVVALSTDKACEPINHYGRTKAEAESLFVHAPEGRTVCVVTRYGNVVGSSGSVLPLFVAQRRQGVLTVTDLRATRFFMPLSDACDWSVFQEPGRRPVFSAVDLVRYALRYGHHGDLLVPTIPSGTIANLAQEIGAGCRIDEIGLRPGEKLHEQLISAEELTRTVRLPQGIFCVRPDRVDVPVSVMDPTFRYTSDVQPLPIRVEWNVAA